MVSFLLLRSLTWERTGQFDMALEDVDIALVRTGEESSSRSN